MNTITQHISARQFWSAFKERLREGGSRKLYVDEHAWSDFIARSAEEVCAEFGLRTQRDYLRLDVAGYERVEFRRVWNLRVAFAHENGAGWDYDLCKLADVVADLHVLFVQHDYASGGDVATALRPSLEKLSPRMRRQRDSEWLVVVGPLENDLARPFRAFVCDSTDPLRLREVLEEGEPAHFSPKSWAR